jgi:hypothetical protein
LRKNVEIVNFQISNLFLLGNLTKDYRCVTVLETPQIFSSLEAIEVTEMISKHCFDHTLIAINPRTEDDPLTIHEREVLVSLLRFMTEAIYTQAFWEKLTFVFFSSSDQGELLHIMLKIKVMSVNFSSIL